MLNLKNIKPLPEHKTYAGALVGGTKTAASNTAKLLGEAFAPDKPGHCKRNLNSRMSSLSFIPSSVSSAYKAHTMSFHDPEAYTKANAAIAKFQQGQ